MELHKELTKEEVLGFRQWARDNWPFREGFSWHDEPKATWHPVVQRECRRMSNEYRMGLKLRLSGHTAEEVKVIIEHKRNTYDGIL